MRFTQTIKALVPAPFRPPLRRIRDRVIRQIRGPLAYDDRVRNEIDIYVATEVVHDLPEIAHYWSTKYLVPMLEPFGFTSFIDMFRTYIMRHCRQHPAETCMVLSIGAGDFASEVNVAQWLVENECRNFQFECLDINSVVLERGLAKAVRAGVREWFTTGVFDLNTWAPARSYDIILAVQCLHHFQELELLFDKVHAALHPDGYFLADDMIGRNGHQRWPEALTLVEAFWRELPRTFTHNHALKCDEPRFINRDYSGESFEGIRAQDILPLLVERFHFDVFAGFANIIDVFIDRCYGPNFDPSREWDRSFIDRVHATDVREMESGRIKPTHMYAAMTRKPVAVPRFHKNLSAEFCVRKTQVSGWKAWKKQLDAMRARRS